MNSGKILGRSLVEMIAKSLVLFEIYLPALDADFAK